MLFLLAALAGVLYVHVQSDRNAERSAMRNATFAAQSASRLISEGVTTLHTQLAATASDAAAYRGLVAHPSQCGLTFAQVGAFPAGHIDVLHADGRVVCSSLHGSRNPHGYTGQSWVTQARSRPVTLAPVHDAVTGQPVAVFAAPFGAGIIVAFEDLRPVGPDLTSELAGPRGLEYLVTTAGGGSVLAASREPERWVGGSLSATAFAHASSHNDRPDLLGQRTLFAQDRVSDVGWRVYAGIDRRTALAAAGSLYHSDLIIILGAMVVVLIAAAVVQRQIARPVGQLAAALRTRSAHSIERLRGVRGPAELTDLAHNARELITAVETELGERQRAEQAATAAEHEARETAKAYRLLFQNNPQPMWIYDVETLEIFEVNDAAILSYGYTREQFLSMTIKDLRPADDVSAMLESVAGQGVSDLSGPWRHVKADGTIIEVEIISHAVDFRGRRGRLIMASDVTDRERLQRHLAQVQRLESLGQLAGGVAHDFNNLLGVILNYAAFVRDEVAKAQRGEPGVEWSSVSADVDQIHKAARRATALTRQLLAFARREVINPDVITLNDIVAETDALLRRTLGAHIELVSSLADDLWPVLADAGQVEQVLMNLAVNARDAMPTGGTLHIETSNVKVDESYASSRPELEPGRYVRLRVSDTGMGMDPAVAERAFEPFFTTKSKGEGTGLGLATIYGIITQAGGQVRLYSEPGIGTTFTILLPATEQQARRLSDPGLPAVGGTGEVVLVVEDEDGIREVATRILSQWGYHVLTASRGDEAIEIARAHDGPIDLLVTDVIMPGMLGKEVAERLLAMRPTLRVMYMSGYAQPVLGSSNTLPSDMVLIEKPFSERELLAKVREALGAAEPAV